MVYMSAKFDKEICNGLVAIVFTRSKPDAHTYTHGTTAALLYPHRNALCGDNKKYMLDATGLLHGSAVGCNIVAIYI